MHEFLAHILTIFSSLSFDVLVPRPLTKLKRAWYIYMYIVAFCVLFCPILPSNIAANILGVPIELHQIELTELEMAPFLVSFLYKEVLSHLWEIAE